MNIDLKNIKVISCSTNLTAVCSLNGEDVIVKQQLLNEQTLSPFWKKMKCLFDSDFSSQRRAMLNLCALLSQNPHIPIAKLIETDEENKVSVFEKMSGDMWEPDEFPKGAPIAFQLGQFVGFNHRYLTGSYGLPGRPIDDFPLRLESYIRRILASGEISGLPDCVKFFNSKEYTSIGCALVMTDFSANQFLFGMDCITACVDLDAYVFGPVEWELTLVEDTVADVNSFRRGYETYLPYPDLNGKRELYHFLMEEYE